MDEIQRKAEELSRKISGEMDAHLIESIVSLFNEGVLVHHVRSPRMSFAPDNCKMSVDAASGVRFEGREKIIKLQQENAELKAANFKYIESLGKCGERGKELRKLLREACHEIKTSCDYDDSWMDEITDESEPEFQRYVGFKKFLHRPEVKKIIEQEGL